MENYITQCTMYNTTYCNAVSPPPWPLPICCRVFWGRVGGWQPPLVIINIITNTITITITITITSIVEIVIKDTIMIVFSSHRIISLEQHNERSDNPTFSDLAGN